MSIRLLEAVKTWQNLNCDQMDFVAAYLDGSLDVAIFMSDVDSTALAVVDFGNHRSLLRPQTMPHSHSPSFDENALVLRLPLGKCIVA